MDVMTEGEPIELGNYLEALLETLADAIVVVIDRNLGMVHINPAGMAVLGATSIDEVLQLNVADILSPEDQVALRKRYAATLLGHGDPADPVVVPITSLDGEVKILECCMARLVGINGRRRGILIRARDITERCELRRLAEERESLLSAILATIPDALVVINEQGLITSFNAAAEKMFGYREADTLGRNVSMLMPSPHQDSHDGYIARYFKTGERRMIGIGRVLEGRRSDGSIFPIEMSVGEARWQRQRAFTGIVRDLTERFETEARLYETQSELAHASRLSAVGTLASALAHEINQPLGAIVNYLSSGRAVLEGNGLEARKIAGDAMDLAANEALRAGQIVHRLREFVSKGDSDLQFCSLELLIDEATKLGLVGTRELGVECVVEIDPDVGDVFVDRIQIQQVIVNLIRNAIEAMQDSPVRRIEIRTRLHSEDKVEVSIADTGPGIAPAVVDNLFKPFTSTKGKGMGLGLSICRRIVNAHGGELTVEAGKIGGTVFRFTLTCEVPEIPEMPLML